MKRGETIEKAEAEDALAEARRRHALALAEGRACACEGPHVRLCGIDGRLAGAYVVDGEVVIP